MFLTSAKKRINVKLLVLDCDGIIFNSNNLKTNAYRETLRGMGVSKKGVDDFVELHLSDVSVSRFVKFSRFFKEMYHDLAGSGENAEKQLVENEDSEQCCVCTQV